MLSLISEGERNRGHGRERHF